MVVTPSKKKSKLTYADSEPSCGPHVLLLLTLISSKGSFALCPNINVLTRNIPYILLLSEPKVRSLFHYIAQDYSICLCHQSAETLMPTMITWVHSGPIGLLVL